MKTTQKKERQPLVDAQERPSGVPDKFNIDGSVRAFPGNTILCHLPQNCPLRAKLRALYETLQGSNRDTLFTLLPPSSWHMTVFEGVCDEVRGQGLWPNDLPPDASLETCNRLFSQKLLAFEMKTQPPFRLKVAGYRPCKNGITLDLQPATTSEEIRLRNLRDRLSDALQIRHAAHDTYGFHLSIAYFIRLATDQERQALEEQLFSHLQDIPLAFELGAPEFCDFDDMFAFRRQFYLK